ncbi:MAG: hypothetical protein COW00_02255 [Bdellovibrio sp. CG12_big_fil_rev_8_21_14_0_65_39_13]|nr:MAG: hypothetical protein COW78_14510 [Bdellovibrio sp. CG22_combo_CG10-13_8_21_14_all_39_27]PIQ62204.1 MAG: hypothetical protein COW00_02255 [Bdellovibrio sp. CG12_big_fil_rev_8_21_14_0_65_39_13]PIR34215.1 MAG: hypothetical protein COV37_14000 [Bdellovibrio sp. CG11_big_fil_rev_8_21_14_0_20_39_38]
MKILVTGATGFVGSHLCEELSRKGHQVYGLVRNPKKLKDFNFQGIVIKGDLNLEQDWQWIDEIPSDLDAIIHTAGIVHSFQTEHFFDVNSKATAKFIHYVKDKFPRMKFMLVSSLAASGPSLNGIQRQEEFQSEPTSHYGLSKLEAEMHLFNLAPENWQKIVIRPPMIIGPRDPAVLDFFKMVKSRVVVLPGKNGPQKEYSFVCVYDLVDSMIKAIESTNLQKEIFFISNPQVIKALELVTTIEKHMKKKALILALPMPLIKSTAYILAALNKLTGLDARLTPDKIRELSPSSWMCNGEKSSKLLSMNYQWDLDRTIKITVEDYLKRGWI